MFERFTEGARRSLFFARHEAVRRGSALIESQHLLLGVVRGDRDPVPDILACFGVTADDVSQRVDAREPVRDCGTSSIDIGFSVEVQRILNRAQHEADQLAHRHIGPEHLLLGLLREEQSVGASILSELGVTATALRAHVAALPPRTEPLRAGSDIAGAVDVIKVLVDQLRRAERNTPEAENLVARIYRALDGLGGRPVSEVHPPSR